MRESARLAAVSVGALLVACLALAAQAQPAVPPTTLPPPTPGPPPAPAPLPAPAPAPVTAPAPDKVKGAAETGEDPSGLFDPLPSRTLPPLAAAPDTAPGWRRLAFGVTAGAAGLSLIGGLSFLVVESQKVREFNAYVAPEGTVPDRCTAGTPNEGAPGCADLLAESRRARMWSIVSFSFAGAFAATALVLRLTYPDRRTAASSPPRLACAPAPGLAATCRATF
jgi:hypothetical protein